MRIDFLDFYSGKTVIPVEKYCLDNGILNTRQMTYAFINFYKSESILEPTFEVDDVVLSRFDDSAYVIRKYDRSSNEMYAEALDANVDESNKYTYFEEADIYHKLKNVEWINKK